METIAELLRDHVTLEVECIDRLYLNGYMPKVQTGGHLVTLLMEHFGMRIPSPAILGRITQRYVQAIKTFAAEQDIPVVHFKHGERKDDIANALRAERGIQDGVVFIGVAQEKAWAFQAHKRDKTGYVGFEYTRDKPVYVNHYYVYLDDAEFGPGFIKVCSYAPWGLKVCLNGHEWAKRQLERRGVAFESLDNGFLSCADPEALQTLCHALGPQDLERFLARWLERLPMPLDARARDAGYDYALSIKQLEVSLTQVFDRPLRGREFFEEVIRDNLDLGRPDRVQLIFGRRVTKATPGAFRTRVIQDGVHPSLHIEYKHFDLKQYFKENRALRTEGTFKDPKDFGVNKDIRHLPHLYELGRNINRRLLDVQRVSQNCGMSGESIQRVVEPTVAPDGQRTPGLRMGNPRVMALLLALTSFIHLVDGFSNKDLRRLVADLLDTDPAHYTAGHMTYDLRRLRLKGIIARVPGKNRYFLTPYGWKVARFFSRLDARVFRPALTAFTSSETPYPRPLLKALRNVDQQLDRLIHDTFPATKIA
jgi:hypothetical protein